MHNSTTISALIALCISLVITWFAVDVLYSLFGEVTILFAFPVGYVIGKIICEKLMPLGFD